MNKWQWVAGGVEQNEDVNDAAIREAEEELGIQITKKENLLRLESYCTMPRSIFDCEAYWPKTFYTVKEFSFALKLDNTTAISISDEHLQFKLIRYSDLVKFKTWDSNRTAAWELNERLKDLGEKD